MASPPPRAREFLEPALAGDWTWEDVEARINADLAQLWVHPEGAIVTEHVVTGEETCLHVWLGGGSLRALLILKPEIERFARDAGCAAITINGRTGWDRVLRRSGYVRRGDELEFRLDVQ
jgi:hypothetical protein